MSATEQLQLSLFSADRLAKRPYCSNDPKNHGIYRLSRSDALKHSHIQANAPVMIYRMVFDIDFAGAVFAAEDANVAPTNWASENRENGHAHVGYELELPICTSDRGRSAPIRYLAAVENAYRRALKADQSYGGFICKNPLSDVWRTQVHRVEPYTLFELAEYVDISKKLTKKQSCETPIGRNVTLFDSLRAWSYKNVRNYDSAAEFKFACSMQVTALNNFVTALSENECKHIAKSVSDWTWSNFDVAASDARYSKLQAFRNSLGGVAARQASLDVRAAKADAKAVEVKSLQATGMTKAAIVEMTGFSLRSVSDLLKRQYTV